MLESFTAGALRALARARARASHRGSPLIEPADLLAALADEPESRAGEILIAHGLAPDAVFDAIDAAPTDPLPAGAETPHVDEIDPAGMPHSPALREALAGAAHQARSFDRGRAVGTEHLLIGLLAAPAPVGDLLLNAGLVPVVIQQREDAPETGPIAPDDDLPAPVLAEPGEAADLARVFDASANRAREGLRVAEDYVRFVLDDPGLTRRLKDVRHRLADALRALDPGLLVTARDTTGDVGTHVTLPSEQHRPDARAVLLANFKRTAEALRTLEEYGKLVDVWLAGRFEVLRYDVYTLEKLTLAAAHARRAVGDARLYLLVGGLRTLGDVRWLVGEALDGGVQAVQLREKNLPDREVLRRAAEVRRLTSAYQAVFVMNDRPDLARVSGADGVHLGQDDLSVRDARRVVGPNAAVGVSTHDAEQLDLAVLGGASYLGVGPVFPSDTKAFGSFPGLAFVRHAAGATNLPWFAIGGIHEQTIDAALEAGARRVAVSAAIVRAERPRAGARLLRERG